MLNCTYTLYISIIRFDIISGHCSHALCSKKETPSFMFELPVQRRLSLARLSICGGISHCVHISVWTVCSWNMVLSVVLCVLAVGSLFVQASEEKQLVHVIVVRTLVAFFPSAACAKSPNCAGKFSDCIFSLTFWIDTRVFTIKQKLSVIRQIYY